MFENAYNTFFYKYGFRLLDDDYIEKLDKMKENEMYLTMYAQFSQHLFYLEEWQKIYKKF